jgi:predicted nucleotidyltransferase
MNLLALILGSQIRAEIFRLLFVFSGTRLHIREIQRRTGFNDSAIRQELAKLARLELLTPQRDGNRLYYSARQDHPLYADLRNLTLKTVGLGGVLEQALESQQVAIAFVFGSLARNAEKAASDVDLMLIGSVGLREASRLLSGVTEKVGRAINPHVFTPAEFQQRLKRKDHFLSAVLKEPRFFVKGDERNLAELAK